MSADPVGPVFRSVALRLFIAIAVLAGMIAATSAAELVQRMRIPVGEYWIGGSGGGGPGRDGVQGRRFVGTSTGGPGSYRPIELRTAATGVSPGGGTKPAFVLPAYCIDEGRGEPFEDDRFSYASQNIKVYRYEGDQLKEERTLNDAIAGPAPWLEVRGSSAAALQIVPLQDKFDYRIVVSGLAIVGQSEADVSSAVNAWKENVELSKASEALDAIRGLLLAGTTVNTKELASFEIARRAIEWAQFGDNKGGAAIAGSKPDLSNISKSIAGLVLRTREGLTSGSLLDWIVLSRGASLSSEETSVLSMQLERLRLGQLPANDGSMNARLLAAYSAAAALGVTRLAAVSELKKERNIQLGEALERATFRVGNEDMWTAGRPALYLLPRLRCSDESSINQFVTLRDLMRSVDGYNSAPIDSGLVGLISNYSGTDCVVRVDKDGNLAIDTVKADELSQEFLSANFPGRLVAVNGLAERRLTQLNVKFERLDAVSRSISKNSFSEKTNSGRKEFAHFRRQEETATGLDLTALNLETLGDALVVRAPDNSILMVDTGLNRNTLKQFSSLLAQKYKRTKPPLRLVITHSHEDHIGGLKALVDNGFQIDELIIGRSKADKGTLVNLKALLAGGTVTDHRFDESPGVTHILRNGTESLFLPDTRKVSRRAIESWDLREIAGISIRIHHVIDARVPNEGGLLVRMTYRGMNWLLSDDLSKEAIAKIASSLDGGDLRAGILKWPHHLWLPPEGDVSARENLSEFLRMISPHTIIFSNVGHKTHNPDRYDEIKKFVSKVLERDVNMTWTRDVKGDVVIKADQGPLFPRL